MDLFKNNRKDKTSMLGRVCTCCIVLLVVLFVIYNCVNVFQGKGGVYEQELRPLDLSKAEGVDFGTANIMMFLALSKLSEPDKPVPYDELMKHANVQLVDMTLNKKSTPKESSSKQAAYRECTKADFDQNAMTRELYENLKDERLLLCPPSSLDGFELKGGENSVARRTVDVELERCEPSQQQGCSGDINYLKNLEMETFVMYSKLNPVSVGQDEPLITVFELLGLSTFQDTNPINGRQVAIRTNIMQADEPFYHLTTFETRRFYDYARSESTTFRRGSNNRLLSRTRLYLDKEENVFKNKNMSLVDLISQMGGLFSGLALGAGCFLFPMAKCSADAEFYKANHGVELSCCEMFAMSLGCTCCSCCQNKQVAEIEEKERKAQEPQLEITELLPIAKAKQQPVKLPPPKPKVEEPVAKLEEKELEANQETDRAKLIEQKEEKPLLDSQEKVVVETPKPVAKAESSSGGGCCSTVPKAKPKKPEVNVEGQAEKKKLGTTPKVDVPEPATEVKLEVDGADVQPPIISSSPPQLPEFNKEEENFGYPADYRRSSVNEHVNANADIIEQQVVIDPKMTINSKLNGYSGLEQQEVAVKNPTAVIVHEGELRGRRIELQKGPNHVEVSDMVVYDAVNVTDVKLQRINVHVDQYDEDGTSEQVHANVPHGDLGLISGTTFVDGEVEQKHVKFGSHQINIDEHGSIEERNVEYYERGNDFMLNAKKNLKHQRIHIGVLDNEGDEPPSMIDDESMDRRSGKFVTEREPIIETVIHQRDMQDEYGIKVNVTDQSPYRYYKDHDYKLLDVDRPVDSKGKLIQYANSDSYKHRQRYHHPDSKREPVDLELHSKRSDNSQPPWYMTHYHEVEVDGVWRRYPMPWAEYWSDNQHKKRRHVAQYDENGVYNPDYVRRYSQIEEDYGEEEDQGFFSGLLKKGNQLIWE